MLVNKSPLKIAILLIVTFLIFTPRYYVSAGSIHSQPLLIRLEDIPGGDLIPKPMPTLFEFIASLESSDIDRVVGLYIPRILAVHVLQQPINNPAFVSNTPDVVTQFRLADPYGSKGFLVHYNEVGRRFLDIDVGHQIFLIYGNGEYEKFIVHELLRFQALTPNSPYSSFRELGHINSIYSTVELFNWVYNEQDRVILQTCIKLDDNPNWGRYFVVATLPVVLPKSNVRFQE
jgi:hypothetical protein